MKVILKRFKKNIVLPTLLELPSIHETWSVIYEEADQSRTTIKQIDPYQLRIKGLMKDKQKNLLCIQHWLKNKAARHLSAWMDALSTDVGLNFTRLTIRGQKTRWGSCSSTKSINLNYKLLFLPAPIVEYVMLHELCHTRNLDHSNNFWRLVEKYDINYKIHRRQLRQVEKQLPNWLP